MKRTNLFYWIFTGLLAAGMLLSAIPDLVSTPEAVTIVSKHLGYPAYFLPFIGVAKILGAIVILIPGFTTLKEWAYAGFVYDLTGAVYSGIAVGDPFSLWWPIFIFFGVLITSYIYFKKKYMPV